MASSFEKWEKDPFFSAAEEVQQSADRMESTYRTWIHAKKNANANANAAASWDTDELRRDLQTALGTTKWQLDEFERAVKSSYTKTSIDDGKDRHRQFIVAIEDQVSITQTSLQESSISEGKPPLPWIHLDEREYDELALFLSGPATFEDKLSTKIAAKNNQVPRSTVNEQAPQLSNKYNPSLCVESPGHRRTASASAYTGSWEIAIKDNAYRQSSSLEQPPVPPRKIPSFSGFISSMNSAHKFKCPKNGIRKWKGVDRKQEDDVALLPSSQLTRGIDVCYEKSKSFLDSSDDCYDKQLHGWYGAIQRRLQRSQYQMQYRRPVQVFLWIVLSLCLIVLIARVT